MGTITIMSALHGRILRVMRMVDVVTHYDSCFSLGLTAQEQSDVVEYVRSLPRRR